VLQKTVPAVKEGWGSLRSKVGNVTNLHSETDGAVIGNWLHRLSSSMEENKDIWQQWHLTTMALSLYCRGFQMECHRGSSRRKGRIVERKSFTMACGTPPDKKWRRCWTGFKRVRRERVMLWVFWWIWNREQIKMGFLLRSWKIREAWWGWDFCCTYSACLCVLLWCRLSFNVESLDLSWSSIFLMSTLF
jgi:hypothetical protein